MKDLDKFKNEMNLSGKNVYVGHRYVPKIFGEWDNTQIYEPLSIVQYQGNSFTSRQYVPTGIEITNEDFWAATGNYNAQIEQFRQDVVNLGNVNNEVINARNGETSLGVRLDNEKEEVNNQLLQNATKWNNLGIVNVKDFGAKGDGLTDDTEAIKNAVESNADTVFFPKGTYIINVPKRENATSQWLPIFKSNVNHLKGVKGKSIIKLGSNNGDARTTGLTGYTSMFEFNNKKDEHVMIDSLVFDFNGVVNPTYHREDQLPSSGIPHGVRQSVVDAEYIGDFTFKDNIVIDHQGTNAIVYKANEDNVKAPTIRVYNNEFLNVGREFGEGLHDHSTIYIHEYTHDPENELIKNRPFAYVYNNKFEGSFTGAPNAFCAIEMGVSAKVYNNNISNYFVGILIFSRGKDNKVNCYQNNLHEVGLSFYLWSSRLSSDYDSGTTKAYRLVRISDNNTHTTPQLFAKKYNYGNYDSITPEGFYPYHQAFISTYSDVSRDIDTLEVENNVYKLDSGISYHVDPTFRYSSNVIEFRGDSTLRYIYMDNLKIVNNHFENIPNGVLRLAILKGAGNVTINDNQIINPMINNEKIAVSNRTLFWLDKSSTEDNSGIKELRVFNNNIINSSLNSERFVSIYIPTAVPLKPSISIGNNKGADTFKTYINVSQFNDLIIDEKMFANMSISTQNILQANLKIHNEKMDVNFSGGVHTFENNRYIQITNELTNLIAKYVFKKGDLVKVDIVSGQPYIYMNSGDAAVNWVSIINAGV